MLFKTLNVATYHLKYLLEIFKIINNFLAKEIIFYEKKSKPDLRIKNNSDYDYKTHNRHVAIFFWFDFKYFIKLT